MPKTPFTPVEFTSQTPLTVFNPSIATSTRHDTGTPTEPAALRVKVNSIEEDLGKPHLRPDEPSRAAAVNEAIEHFTKRADSAVSYETEDDDRQQSLPNRRSRGRRLALGASIGVLLVAGVVEKLVGIANSNTLKGELTQSYAKVERELQRHQINPDSVIRFSSPAEPTSSYREAEIIAQGDVQGLTGILSKQAGNSDVLAPNTPLIGPKSDIDVRALKSLEDQKKPS
jgi:hypothetical protein